MNQGENWAKRNIQVPILEPTEILWGVRCRHSYLPKRNSIFFPARMDMTSVGISRILFSYNTIGNFMEEEWLWWSSNPSTEARVEVPEDDYSAALCAQFRDLAFWGTLFLDIFRHGMSWPVESNPIQWDHIERNLINRALGHRTLGQSQWVQSGFSKRCAWSALYLEFQ